MSDMTVERARELLDYDPLTGSLTWKVRRSKTAIAGSTAGCLTRFGYWKVVVDGRQYYAHRLAWLIVNGEWPTNQIDHKNGVRTDNRIVNLRDVTRITNNENRRLPESCNKLGILGVFKSQGCKNFCAQIKIKGKSIHLGSFPSTQEAHAAYLEAKRQHHQGCTI